MVKIIGPQKFGVSDGKDVYEVLLHSETGVQISIINYGALIRDWRVPVPNTDGESRSVVLGFEHFDDYLEHSPYFGAIVGRVANRIGNAQFELDGKEYRLLANEGSNHLHGGNGAGKKVWDMEVRENGCVHLSLTSPDGENGYPGKLDMTVTYRLNGNRLSIDFEAIADAPTPVNLVQHNYFNLAGNGDIRKHVLWVNAREYTVFGDEKIPTGEIRPVSGTKLDFSEPKEVVDENGDPLALDDNFVLNRDRGPSSPAAILQAPDKSLTLKLWTDQPGVQVYTGVGMNIAVPGLGGRVYPKFGGICLEDQNFPDAVNKSHFPSPILRPGSTYKHLCEIEIL